MLGEVNEDGYYRQGLATMRRMLGEMRVTRRGMAGIFRFSRLYGRDLNPKQAISQIHPRPAQLRSGTKDNSQGADELDGVDNAGESGSRGEESEGATSWGLLYEDSANRFLDSEPTPQQPGS